MYNGKRVLAVIPARSGSKGLPDKNILLFNGKPLLSYSIEAARNSGVVDEIFVSTNSPQYAYIAKASGASVPFLRSEALAREQSSSWECVIEALKNYEMMGKVFEYVLLLQPTSPLRKSQDIVDSLRLSEQLTADSIISVCETDHSVLWCNKLPQNQSMKNFIQDEIKNVPRQRMPVYYRINGAIYLVRVDYLKKSRDIFHCRSYAYIMPKERSVDIDTEYDFIIAEALAKRYE
ncbi:MAG: acylneuraminate cytidylyltransferase family protein [Clostridiaceae bacterium]|nr:acylneuraminate cytidylyltransferase family protein [Clostridiaceae bacterium]